MKVSLTEAKPDLETLPRLDPDTPPRVALSTENTPTPERTLKVTIISRYRSGECCHSIVPEIRFGGRYLEEFKFLIGTRLRITVKKGRITIRPDKYQPWLPEEIAKEVREASAMENS